MGNLFICFLMQAKIVVLEEKLDWEGDIICQRNECSILSLGSEKLIEHAVNINTAECRLGISL